MTTSTELIVCLKETDCCRYPQVQDKSPMQSLLTALRAIDAPLYAVIDGAKVENLPGLLFDNDLSAKRLCLDTGSENREVERTVPQLVRFDRWAHWENGFTAWERVESLLGALETAGAGLASCVFWLHAGEPKRLYRHLRTINNVLIPRDPDTPPLPDPYDPDPDTDAALNTATHQQVLFRHADANVVAQVFPELGVDRLARVLGPASTVVCQPDIEWMDEDWAMSGSETIMRIDNPADHAIWDRKSAAARARLELSGSTMNRIHARRENSLVLQIMAFLMADSPALVATHTAASLRKLAVRSVTVAEGLDTGSLEGCRMWAYLMLRTAGRVAENECVTDFVRYDARPHQALQQIVGRATTMTEIDVEGLV